jgi:hypothetical protein
VRLLSPRVRSAPAIEAQASSAHRSYLEQPTRDGEVLEEMDDLVLVGEVVVKQERGRNREQGEYRGSQACLESNQQKQSGADLDDEREGINDAGGWQARGRDVRHGRGGCAKFGCTTHEKQGGEEDAAESRDGSVTHDFGARL